MDNFRDTFVGQVVRLISRNRLLKYPDEINPQAYERSITADRTLTQAQSLQTWTTTRNANTLELETSSTGRPPASRRSTATRPTAQSETDQELAKLETQADDIDTKVVTWIDDHDPENPQNWSFLKKCTTTAQVCFLTFSIYVGSAIYTAGVRDIEQYFGIGEVSAVLGLTSFVLGYGIGE